MRLFLDDIRIPSQHGFSDALWAQTYEQCIDMLAKGGITFASLDHDIGACRNCTEKGMHIGDMLTAETYFYNTCPHAKNGYDVVRWIDEHNVWPKDGVRVHSANPVGKARMQAVIDNHYRRAQ